MKKFLLFGVLTFHVCIYAQQCPPVNKENQEDPVVDDSPLLTHDMQEGKDFSGDYAVRGLKIGGGITGGLYTSGFGHTRKGFSQDSYWNHNKTGGFLEIIYQLNTKRNISFGLAATFNPLWKQKESFVTEPIYTQPETLPFEPQATPETLYALRWNMVKELKLNNFLFFSDIELYRINKKIDLFIRPEIGISNYRGKLTIQTSDTCDCDYTAYSSTDRKTAFTGGLGLGMNLNFTYIEIKSILGYRIYDMRGMASRDDFSQWRTSFDQESYDFKGGTPAPGLFTVDKPENSEQIRRTGVLYFQIGLYLNFGEMLN